MKYFSLHLLYRHHLHHLFYSLLSIYSVYPGLLFAASSNDMCEEFFCKITFTYTCDMIDSNEME